MAPLSFKSVPRDRLGKHIIQLNNSTATAPGAYLNTQQSPQDHIYAHLDNKQEFVLSSTRPRTPDRRSTLSNGGTPSALLDSTVMRRGQR